MNNRGPILTLLAVVVLAAVLLVVNTTVRGLTAGRTTGTPAPATAPATTPPAPAPAPAEAPEQASYAGRTSGNEATIAIAVRAGRAAAYVCDGRRIEAWLQGSITEGRLVVQGARGARASGTREGDAIFGIVEVNGKRWPFSAKLASPPAGLYQGSGTVNGVPNRLGWIVLQDGSQVGLRNMGGTREPAPPLELPGPQAVTVEDARIEPQQVSGDTQVVGIPGGPPA